MATSIFFLSFSQLSVKLLKVFKNYKVTCKQCKSFVIVSFKKDKYLLDLIF